MLTSEAVAVLSICTLCILHIEGKRVFWVGWLACGRVCQELSDLTVLRPFIDRFGQVRACMQFDFLFLGVGEVSPGPWRLVPAGTRPARGPARSMQLIFGGVGEPCTLEASLGWLVCALACE